MDSDYKFIKHFTSDRNLTFTTPFNKMAAGKSNCLYIFKTRYFEGCYTDSFSIYTYIGVDILNILLLDLDRHPHPPFLKMAAVFINVAISYQIWHLES